MEMNLQTIKCVFTCISIPKTKVVFQMYVWKTQDLWKQGFKQLYSVMPKRVPFLISYLNKCNTIPARQILKENSVISPPLLPLFPLLFVPMLTYVTLLQSQYPLFPPFA